MRILIAPAAYKGTLSPLQACVAMAEGVRRQIPDAEIDLCPISDGGTGWLEVWKFHFGSAHTSLATLSKSVAAHWMPQRLAVMQTTVHDPLGRPISAEYLLADSVAILESALACGIHLLQPEALRPLDASTEGVGELLRAVDCPDIEAIWLGLGGTATTDGGTGALQALGFQFLAADGSPIPRGGGGLLTLARIEPPAQMPLQGKRLVLCADVRNPLCGEQGAARVFAPQKGADPQQVALLEAGLQRLATVIRQQTGLDVAELPGAGAAGGLPVGFVAFMNATLVSGIEWLLQHVGWHERLRQADLLLTGEGQVDAQTLMGKGVGELVKRAVASGKPVRIVAGRLGDGADALLELPGVQVVAVQQVAPDQLPSVAVATAVAAVL